MPAAHISRIRPGAPGPAGSRPSPMLLGVGAAVAAVAVGAAGLAAQWSARGGAGAGVAAPLEAHSAAAFVASLGVNTHLGWQGTAYSDLRQVEAAADYIGVHTFRDTIDSVPAIRQAAAAGIRFDLVAYPSQTSFLSEVGALAQAHPGAVAAIEGPNEVDGWPVTYQGVRGYAAAVAFQKALYRAVHADPLLAGTPVYNLTVSGVEAAKYAALGDLSAFCDYANVHIYYSSGQPMWGWSPGDPKFFWTSWLKAGQGSAPGKPPVVTEVGATTWKGGVSEAVQAKQMLNALMDAASTGVAATYVYELADSRTDPGRGESEAHFGLFDRDWTPKPAARALHNLTRILTPRPGGGADRATAPLALSVEGVPEQGGRRLLQQRDGTYDLVVWAEPMIWNASLHAEVATPAAKVVVRLAEPKSVAVYDPMQGASPVQRPGVTRSFSVAVVDHPVVIELSPASSRGVAVAGAR